jgi:hypothetical protein
MTCLEAYAHVMTCKECMDRIIAYNAGMAGRSKSEDKARAARENGKKGGRPHRNKE